MTEAPASLLSMLQHADSMFPSGAVSFSWGLEPLFNRHIVTDRDGLSAFLGAHLRFRWAMLDRVILHHAHLAGGDLDHLFRLDRLTEAQSLSAEQRLGSTRMGAALLSVHRKLGTPGAAEYADHVAAGRAFGHIPVIQGLLWRETGLDLHQVTEMSAHGLCTGILGAAIRLSIVGHVHAQQIHADQIPLIREVMATPVCAPEKAHSFIPQIEVASMKHETDDMRLFVN